MENKLDSLVDLLWKIDNLRENLYKQEVALNEMEDKLDKIRQALSSVSAAAYSFTTLKQHVFLCEMLTLYNLLFQSQHSSALKWQNELNKIIIQEIFVTCIFNKWKTELNRLTTKCYLHLQRLNTIKHKMEMLNFE